MTRFRTAAGALALALILTLSLTAGVLAHEHRAVGELEFSVGWVVEPAFVGEKNGLDLRITQPLAAAAALTTTEHADEAAGEHSHDEAATRAPVEGAETTLTAEVLFGGSTMALPLRAVYNEPGAYTADIVPTQAGDYRFHISGTVEGQAIDETFDSVGGDFSSVVASTDIQFPAPEPVAAGAQAAAAMSSTLSAAQQTSASTQLLAYLGIGIGLAALCLALAALARGRG